MTLERSAGGINPRVYVIRCEVADCLAAIVTEDRRATYRCINHRPPSIAGDEPGPSYAEDWL